MREQLVDIKGISDAKADKLREAAAKVAKKLTFKTAKDLLHERECTVVKLRTGSAELDLILGGGVESSSISECVHPYQEPS